MKSNESKVVIVGVVLLITLSLLIGGQKLYNSNLIEKPVIKELLKLSYVETAAMVKESDTYHIKVQISQPGSIKNEYNEIDKTIAKNIKERQYEIEILDERDKYLQEELQKMELGIYQAIAQNAYLDLEQRFTELSVRDGFDYLLQIDKQRLYVQISHGEKYLYEIIDLSDTKGVQDKGE